MYVTYEVYADTAYASSDNAVGEAEYPKLAAVADTVIDGWTYGRVGLAVADGEDLSPSVVSLYAAIVNNGRDMVEAASSAAGDALSSFSNGVDSYSFVTSEEAVGKLEDSLGWMIDALPLRFTSAAVYPVGRCHARCYGHCHAR